MKVIIYWYSSRYDWGVAHRIVFFWSEKSWLADRHLVELLVGLLKFDIRYVIIVSSIDWSQFERVL